LEWITGLKERLAGIDKVTVLTDKELPGTYKIDPWKIVLSIEGFTGYQIERALVDGFKIQPEYSDLRQVTMLVAPWQDQNQVEQLLPAIGAIARTGQDKAGVEISELGPMPSIPSQVITPREAAFSSGEWLPLTEAEGRINAGTVAPYPPGIPAMIPGELIRPEDTQYIKTIIKSGGLVKGVDQGRVYVVKG
jgi:arginine/lysine/ornithine decarboxylase